MAGDWIKVETCTPGKAEIIRLARLLSMKHDEALGVVVRFWMWADTNTVDGRVDGVASTDVDAVLSCPGLCSALEMVGWLSIDKQKERITIPKFSRHNGESAKKRALTNRRQAKWRNSSVDGAASTGASTREEKRREEKKQKQDFVLPSWVPEEPWKAWLEVRDKKKVPNTGNALRLAVKDLERLRGEGNDPRAVLEMATLKGWRGLFPVGNQQQAIRIDA